MGHFAIIASKVLTRLNFIDGAIGSLNEARNRVIHAHDPFKRNWLNGNLSNFPVRLLEAVANNLFLQLAESRWWLLWVIQRVHAVLPVRT